MENSVTRRAPSSSDHTFPVAWRPSPGLPSSIHLFKYLRRWDQTKQLRKLTQSGSIYTSTVKTNHRLGCGFQLANTKWLRKAWLLFYGMKGKHNLNGYWMGTTIIKDEDTKLQLSRMTRSRDLIASMRTVPIVQFQDLLRVDWMCSLTWGQ